MRPFLIITICAFMLSGCSSRLPEPITYPYSQQQKMQASHHWEVLAKDLANRINNELILSDNIDTTVFVKPTCGDESTPCLENETSTFNEAFRDLLVTGLYNFGIPTKSKATDETIEVLYKVQVVRHNANRYRSLQPGLLTSLSAAILVLRNAPSELIILTSGVAADVANSSLANSGHYEVIITTSMIENDQYLFRASDIYYINDKDFYQYKENRSQATSLQLKEKEKHSTTPEYDINIPFPSPPVEMDEDTIDGSNQQMDKKGV